MYDAFLMKDAQSFSYYIAKFKLMTEIQHFPGTVTIVC